MERHNHPTRDGATGQLLASLRSQEDPKFWGEVFNVYLEKSSLNLATRQGTKELVEWLNTHDEYAFWSAFFKICKETSFEPTPAVWAKYEISLGDSTGGLCPEKQRVWADLHFLCYYRDEGHGSLFQICMNPGREKDADGHPIFYPEDPVWELVWWNASQAAAVLGISRRTLHKRKGDGTYSKKDLGYTRVNRKTVRYRAKSVTALALSEYNKRVRSEANPAPPHTTSD